MHVRCLSPTVSPHILLAWCWKVCSGLWESYGCTLPARGPAVLIHLQIYSSRFSSLSTEASAYASFRASCNLLSTAAGIMLTYSGQGVGAGIGSVSLRSLRLWILLQAHQLTCCLPTCQSFQWYGWTELSLSPLGSIPTSGWYWMMLSCRHTHSHTPHSESRNGSAESVLMYMGIPYGGYVVSCLVVHVVWSVHVRVCTCYSLVHTCAYAGPSLY